MIRLAKVLVSPHEVFNGMRDKAPFALPYWSILIVVFVCLMIGFINYEDVTAGVLQEDGTMVREFRFHLMFFLGFGVVVVWVWTAIWISCIFLAWSSYYWGVGKVLRVDIGWRNWLGFTSWTAVPAILGSLADTLYVKLVSDGPYILFLSFPLDLMATAQIGDAYWVPIPLIWTFFIAVKGFMSWTEKSFLTSLLVVLPSVVVVALLQFVPSMYFSSW